MKISVVMPVYNAERYLSLSVGSVINQTHTDWELVCVDDGSTDSSGELLDDYAESDSRIRVIHKVNGGVSSARNTGMDAATGELIAFLDADDAYHRETLSAVAELYASKSAEVIRLAWRAVSGSNVAPERYPHETCWREINFSTLEKSSVFISCLGSATVVTRHIADRFRWPELGQGEDLVFTLTCLANSTRRYLIDCALVDYRVHSNSASRRITPELILDTCEYLPKVAELCSAVGEGPVAHADTCRHIMNLLCRRLFGSWKHFETTRDRRRIREAFWRLLERLVGIENCIPWPLRSRMAMAASLRNSWLFALGVVLPYRLERLMGGR